MIGNEYCDAIDEIDNGRDITIVYQQTIWMTNGKNIRAYVDHVSQEGFSVIDEWLLKRNEKKRHFFFFPLFKGGKFWYAFEQYKWMIEIDKKAGVKKKNEANFFWHCISFI